MGPNHYLLGYVKHTLRDSFEGWAYINKNMLSSSSLRKNNEVLTRNGGGKFGKEMCLCICVSGNKHHSWTRHPLHHLNPGWEIHLSLVRISTRSYLGSSLSQCCQVLGCVVHMFKRSSNKPSIESAICSCPFLLCRPSLCPFQPMFILWFILKICYLFRVIDGGYIKALLWLVFFRQLQLIIREWDLGIIQYLGTCMP